MSGCAYFGDEGAAAATSTLTINRFGRETNLERHAVGPGNAGGHARALERARDRLDRREQAVTRRATRSRAIAVVGDRDGAGRRGARISASTAFEAAPAGMSKRSCRCVAARRLRAQGPCADRVSPGTANAQRLEPAREVGGARRVSQGRGANAAEATNGSHDGPTERDFLLWCLWRRDCEPSLRFSDCESR